MLVIGNSGAGKTTTARRIAAAHGLPFHELDQLMFRPGWQPDPAYPDEVARIAARPAWVLDSWGDRRVRALLWARADTVVWLDYPLRTVLPRLFRRSARRTLRRERIFNGNVEAYREWFSRDHPLRSALRDHRRRRAETGRLIAAHPHLTVIRLRRPAETDARLRRPE